MLQALHIPKNCRQARSRKTHPPSLQGSSVQFSKCIEDSYSSMSARIGQGSTDLLSRHKEEMAECSLHRYCMPWNDKPKGTILKSLEVPATEVESATENSTLTSSVNWVGLQSSNPIRDHSTVKSLGPIPCKSVLPAAASVAAWLAPGNVVWAKTAYQKWWPAEVMGERGVLDFSEDKHIGHVLVHFYAINEHAWLDPTGDLSEFDYHFQERSKNPLKAFQDALKQALCKQSRANPRFQLDGFSGEIQNDEPFDTLKTPSSSITKDDCSEKGRGKRKRMQKLHFDELIFPEKRRRTTRRLKIMRHLGLVAPAGSPYSLPHRRSASR